MTILYTGTERNNVLFISEKIYYTITIGDSLLAKLVYVPFNYGTKINCKIITLDIKY